MAEGVRLAMWSGPRNLSTAMMYAFAARGDCRVWDEPFYPAYLAATGLGHPMRDAVTASGTTDPARVAGECLAMAGAPHVYQKHMCQHMVPGFPMEWTDDVTNVFLIRHPARVVASFARKYEAATADAIGAARQAEMFDSMADRTGTTPVVVDSADILADPAGMLSSLCRAVGLPWTDRMLSWDAGPKPFDGVWADHWYGAVHRSTGFGSPDGPPPALDGRYADIATGAMPHYDRLKSHALTPR